MIANIDVTRPFFGSRWIKIYGVRDWQIDEAVDKLAATWGAPAPATSSRAPVSGRLIYALGGMIYALATVGTLLAIAYIVLEMFKVYGPSAPANADILLVVYGGGALLVLAAVGHAGKFVSTAGKRMLHPTARELQAKDPRRPVVFLRSFNDDGTKIVIGKRVTNDHGGTSDVVERLEERLSPSFNAFGPLVAIGRPGEFLPSLGAARDYEPDAQWRDAASKLIDEARLLLLIPGTTEGLRWEMETIASRGHLGKLLVLLPPREQGFIWSNDANRQQRWRVLTSVLGSIPAFTAIGQKLPQDLIAAHLAADGTLVLISGRPRWEYADETYMRAIRHAVYGIFCRAA